MTILTATSLDFAKAHIAKYYDSDFFPKPPEYHALWYAWDEVKAELTSKNVAKLWVSPPRAMTAAKPRGAFRIVHQPEPLDAIVYTALASIIAPSIEAARAPVESKIACSYRFALDDGSYFAGGSGWGDFTTQTEALGQTYSHVLLTDITDFYNQVYLHRLNNAIESADVALKGIADDIEFFLSALNSKASKGLPVGPAASIVMAEAVLIDVDVFLQDRGVAHTRYVDDFRIFSNSPRELYKTLEHLTLYLYNTHRLTISSEKSQVISSKEFIEGQIRSAYAEEKGHILETLRVYNPYSDQMEDLGFYDLDAMAKLEKELHEAFDTLTSYAFVDLGIARSILRTAKRNKIEALAMRVLAKFEFFVPVINDAVLYLNEVLTGQLVSEARPLLEALLDTHHLDNQLTRYWMEWLFAQKPELMTSGSIRAFVLAGNNVENKALAAITTKNVAWVRDHKTVIYDQGARARRAILHASQVLPSDERKHWLKIFMTNSPIALDRFVARWVHDTV